MAMILSRANTEQSSSNRRDSGTAPAPADEEEEDDNDDMEDIRRPRAFSAFAEEEVIRAPDADFVMANVDSFLD